MITVDSESFLAVVVVAAIAAFAAGLIGPRLAVPVVVLEIVLGIVVGPELLSLAQPDEFLEFFSSLGLGMLFFFAGYEIELPAYPRQPAQAGRAGLADLTRAGLLAGRPARPGRRRPVARVHGIGPGHHRHRDAHPGAKRRG